MIKSYTITVEGDRDGNHVSHTFTQKGYNRHDALTSLYRSCKIDPFIDNRFITVKEDK